MTRDMIVAALNDVAAVKMKLDALLQTFDADARGVTKAAIKKSNGRLTDVGIGTLRTMVEAGRSDTEIARGLNITPAAVANQRAKYVAEKHSTKGRGRR